MVGVSVNDCIAKHRIVWRMGTAIVVLMLAGIGWTLTTSLVASSQSQEIGRDMHTIETDFAMFAGRQEEYNKHTAETLRRIDIKVDKIWRNNGHGE